jgi:putative ABC transport system permease protein
VGVLPADFLPPEGILHGELDLWVPLRLAERATELRIFDVSVVARLGPDASASTFQAHAARLMRDVYDDERASAVRDLRTHTIGEVGSVLGRVLAAVALLLVIACVNVASLLLTRATERAGELAVRSALGAGRARIVRHLLAESLLIALYGAAAGGLLALVSVEGFRRLSPGGVPRLAEVVLDGRALAFSCVVALGAVLVFGLVPALRAATRAVAAGGWERQTPGRREGRLRGALVLGETALAVLLVVSSGLLVHDLVRMSTEDPGYRPEGVIAARLRLDILGPYGFRDPLRRSEAFTGLLEGARALSGVSSAALTNKLPTVALQVWTDVTPEGHDEPLRVSTVHLAGDYFQTMGARLADGRWFSDEDARGDPVAIVNETFVREHWPGASTAIGRSIAADRPLARTYRVVGVVADARLRPGVGAVPELYVTGQTNASDAIELVARTDGTPAALAPALIEMVRRFDSDLLADLDVRPMESLAVAALARPRFYTTLFSSFGLTAFLLALIGVYGTTAYAVRARTREIGIRMALGAQRGHVVAGVMGRTLLVVGGGIAVGLGAAALGSRALTDVLVMLEPRDVFTYATVATLVLAAGAVAALVPAGRASRVDPALTLRDDG